MALFPLPLLTLLTLPNNIAITLYYSLIQTSFFLSFFCARKSFVLKYFPSLSADEFSCNEKFVYCARWEYQTYYQIIHIFSTTTNSSMELFLSMEKGVVLRGNISLNYYLNGGDGRAFGAITLVEKIFLNA